MILQMQRREMTVRECFEKAGEPLLLITYTEETGEMAEWKPLSEVDANILPDEDFVLEYGGARDSHGQISFDDGGWQLSGDRVSKRIRRASADRANILGRINRMVSKFYGE